jgi:hypothetical protein
MYIHYILYATLTGYQGDAFPNNRAQRDRQCVCKREKERKREREREREREKANVLIYMHRLVDTHVFPFIPASARSQISHILFSSFANVWRSFLPPFFPAQTPQSGRVCCGCVCVFFFFFSRHTHGLLVPSLAAS